MTMAQSRRAFLCNCGITMGGLALAFDRFSLMNVFAQTNDYKALVCIFLQGGNDSDNVIIPFDDENYAKYAAVRTDAATLRIPQDQLRVIPDPPSHGGRRFGLHPALGNADANPPTGLHSLWQQGKVAAICNVGPLLKEQLTKNEYLSRPDLRPRSLFSHSDQQSQWQTSISDRISYSSGWGGRMADKAATLNPPNVRFPMMVTVNAVTIFTTGEVEQSLAFAPGAVLRLEGFANPLENDRYQAMHQLVEADKMATATLLRGAAMKMDQAIENARELTTLPAVGPFPATSLGNQLMRVAQLIKLNRQSPTLGLNRQLFFCQLGGFDTHQAQVQGGIPTAGNHANLWVQVSNAMKAFYDETVEQGIADNVVTFTLSDFARTFKPNGNLGTDHAWGAHQFIMGGAVRGAEFYGQFANLELGGEQDTDSGGGARGRWIPTTAVDQYGATLATWYGVSEADLPAVFPNLSAFSTPNLGFL
jgi:uncharacterized protein (DUF1501 family)